MKLAFLITALAAVLLAASPAHALSRIKDLVAVEGIRDNQLVGYGVVVGLNGTGDSVRNSPFTQQTLQAYLERMGVNTRGVAMSPKNIAAVMVTADLPPFATQGSRIDVTVSAFGDAKDLMGGQLLVTPLMGADGGVYAVAQGAVTIAGFQAGGQAETVTRGVPTSGRIANGAIIEREIGFKLTGRDELRLSLRNPDITTARRIAQAINTFLGTTAAEARDPTHVQLTVPESYGGDVMRLLSDVEQLTVDPDQVARVVIDEKSGIVVIGADVRISTVAIAQGNLTIRVTETPQVSQPEPFAPEGAETVQVPRTEVEVTEDGRKLAVFKSGVSLQSLVDGLNALGVGPRDMIAILQAIKAQGAMQAEIRVM